MRQVILNFHGIGQPARPLEPGEARYWVSEDLFEETLRIAKRHEDRARVDITFDDGNLSDIAIGLPVLARHDRLATFFVLADRIGQPGSLGQEDMRALIAAGHRIGTHGAAHVDWRAIDSGGLEHELGRGTRDKIATAAGQPVREAAIPFGRYNARVLRALSRHGYERVYSSDGGAWRRGQWLIARTSPRAEMTPRDIEGIILGHEPVARRLRRVVARGVKRLV